MGKGERVVKAMAVIRRPGDGALLVGEDADRAGRRYQRPLGGAVERGERPLDAVRRELREELGLELARVRLLDVLDNVFELDGRPGHELVFLYAADLTDPAGYEIDGRPLLDAPGVRACWRPPGAGAPPLVPAGLAGLLWGPPLTPR